MRVIDEARNGITVGLGLPDPRKPGLQILLDDLMDDGLLRPSGPVDRGGGEGRAARGRAQACPEPGRRAGMADVRVVCCESSARQQVSARSKERQG